MFNHTNTIFKECSLGWSTWSTELTKSNLIKLNWISFMIMFKYDPISTNTLLYEFGDNLKWVIWD